MIPVPKLNEVNETCQNVENVNVELSLADMNAIIAVPSQIRRLMNGTIAIGGTVDWLLLRCDASWVLSGSSKVCHRHNLS